jgi:hypothetical protein
MIDDDDLEKGLEYVPEHLRAGLRRWIKFGVVPGHFLCAVLRNDLDGACRHGDDQSTAALKAIMGFLRRHAPAACHGSPERFQAWLSRHAKLRFARAV